VSTFSIFSDCLSLPYPNSDDDEYTNMTSAFCSFYSYIHHFPSPSPSCLISLYIIVIINAYRKAWSDIIIKRISENEGDNSEEIKKWQDRMAGFQTKYEDAVKAIEAALT
jgi:hypothetical protein